MAEKQMLVLSYRVKFPMDILINNFTIIEIAPRYTRHTRSGFKDDG